MGKLMQNADRGIERQKGDKKYALGQKIPGHVKEFTRQEI